MNTSTAARSASTPAGSTPHGERIFVGPDPLPEVLAAVADAGCTLVDSLGDAEGVVWFGRDPAAIKEALPATVRWLQTPDAGAERWIAAGMTDGPWVVTCAAGAYGPQIAEHALALLLACVHGLPAYARAQVWDSTAWRVRSVADMRVLVVGAGGIGAHLTLLLDALGSAVTVLSRSGRLVPGARACAPAGELDALLPRADAIVLAAPATSATAHLMNDERFALTRADAVLVNVARGTLVDSGALLRALDSGRLGSAGLDVTDPEPLPAGDPLLRHPRVIITPHVANPPERKRAAFAELVRANCELFRLGQPLAGVIDVERGY